VEGFPETGELAVFSLLAKPGTGGEQGLPNDNDLEVLNFFGLGFSRPSRGKVTSA
jgi:hypothetical protein